MKLTTLIENESFIKVIGQNSKNICKIVSIFDGPFSDETLTWVNTKNLHLASAVQAGVIIVESLPEIIHPQVTYLVSENPRTSFKKLLDKLHPEEVIVKIEPSAFIDSSSTVSRGCYVGHNVVIEKNCIIGDNVKIGHNSVIKNGTIIGSKVVIGSNCTIGGVGFGYQKDVLGQYELIRHVGIVKICDNVDIGNNTCIDRAVLGETLIESNVKIDNLVHIAHNAKIHSNALVIANAMVAGSCDIGANTWVAPSSSIMNGITIGQNVTIGMGAVVLKSVEDNKIVVGNPAKELNRN
jgi:UDP-3-O-[3-hydroxymyristoyl] glucosamine N-acyltransferase